MTNQYLGPIKTYADAERVRAALMRKRGDQQAMAAAIMLTSDRWQTVAARPELAQAIVDMAR